MLKLSHQLTYPGKYLPPILALLTASGVNLDDLMKKFIAKASTPLRIDVKAS
jgi:hypothetical protein